MSKKTVKRGRKPGVKVGPYKMNLTQMAEEIKALKAKVAKLEKVLSQMHPSTFEYLKPTETQLHNMELMRKCASDFEANINDNVPDGPDKTYLIRKFREVAMWINIAITRNPRRFPSFLRKNN